MSIKVMAAVWEDTQLDQAETLTMLALADWANDHGKCWPSLKQLMKKTRLSERGLREIIKRLVDQGVLEKTEVSGKGINYVVRPRHYVPPSQEMTPAPHAETPAPRAANTSVTTKTSRAKALSVRAKSLLEVDVDDLQSAAQVWAVTNMGWREWEATAEFRRFFDGAQAHGRKYVDWMAAWRNWCRSPFCKTGKVDPKDDPTWYRKQPMRV